MKTFRKFTEGYYDDPASIFAWDDDGGPTPKSSTSGPQSQKTGGDLQATQAHASNVAMAQQLAALTKTMQNLERVVLGLTQVLSRSGVPQQPPSQPQNSQISR